MNEFCLRCLCTVLVKYINPRYSSHKFIWEIVPESPQATGYQFRKWTACHGVTRRLIKITIWLRKNLPKTKRRMIYFPRGWQMNARIDPRIWVFARFLHHQETDVSVELTTLLKDLSLAGETPGPFQLHSLAKASLYCTDLFCGAIRLSIPRFII